jgi:inosine-uridine nucleoside N-ribohydrolase
MARKIIIDCDPGIDDTVAICIALFDPRVEVLAITSAAGTVDADQATTNVTAIVDLLDPPRYPRVGIAMTPEMRRYPTTVFCTAAMAWADAISNHRSANTKPPAIKLSGI